MKVGSTTVLLLASLRLCRAQDSKPHGVSTMAMPIVIVVIFLLFFSVVRELLRCAWHRRVLQKLEEIKRGQEDFVNGGLEVSNSMQRLTSGRWSVLWLDGRHERVSQLTFDLAPDLSNGEDSSSLVIIRGHGLDSLGECTIDGKFRAHKDRVAWTQTYIYSHHRSGVVVEAWGNVVLEAEGRVHVRGRVRSSEGNGRSGFFVMRPVALDQVMILLQEIAPQIMIGALGGGDERSVQAAPQPVVRREPVELEPVEDGKGSEHTCLVCLDDCEQGACRLPCGHVFHATCVGQWLANHDECPTCKHIVRVLPPPEVQSRQNTAAAAHRQQRPVTMEPAQLHMTHMGAAMGAAQGSDVLIFSSGRDGRRMREMM